jgi:hypothetical protein
LLLIKIQYILSLDVPIAGSEDVKATPFLVGAPPSESDAPGVILPSETFSRNFKAFS